MRDAECEFDVSNKLWPGSCVAELLEHATDSARWFCPSFSCPKLLARFSRSYGTEGELSATPSSAVFGQERRREGLVSREAYRMEAELELR